MKVRLKRSNICRCQMRENITSILNWPFLKVSLNISLTNHKEIRLIFFQLFSFFFFEIKIFLFTGFYVHNLFVCLLSKREYVCAVKCWLCEYYLQMNYWTRNSFLNFIWSALKVPDFFISIFYVMPSLFFLSIIS